MASNKLVTPSVVEAMRAKRERAMEDQAKETRPPKRVKVSWLEEGEEEKKENPSQHALLPFGMSCWDYLPSLVRERILDLAARQLHRQRMARVCCSLVFTHVCQLHKWAKYSVKCVGCNHCSRRRRYGTIDALLAKVRAIETPHAAHWTNGYCNECYEDLMLS